MKTAIAATLLVTLTSAPAFANPVQDADSSLLHIINQTATPSGDVVYRLLSNDALLIGVPVVSGAAISGNWYLPLEAAESELTAGALAAGAKFVFHRPRPYVTYPDMRLPFGRERLDSFPSGHAAISFAGATAIAINQPAWAVPAYTWAGLVCYSRMYAGVHYPTDVLGGAALGIGSAFLANWLFSDLNTRLGVPGAITPPGVPLTWSTGF